MKVRKLFVALVGLALVVPSLAFAQANYELVQLKWTSGAGGALADTGSLQVTNGGVLNANCAVLVIPSDVLRRIAPFGEVGATSAALVHAKLFIVGKLWQSTAAESAVVMYSKGVAGYRPMFSTAALVGSTSWLGGSYVTGAANGTFFNLTIDPDAASTATDANLAGWPEVRFAVGLGGNVSTAKLNAAKAYLYLPVKR